MEKFKGVFKLDINNLFKSKIFIVSMILLLLGVGQIFIIICTDESLISYLSLFKYYALFLLFLNFSSIFLLVKLSEEKNEIFKSMNISIKEQGLSKILMVIIINLLYSFTAVMLYIVFGLITRMDFIGILAYIKPIIIYQFITILIYDGIALIVGKLFIKYINGFFAYLISGILVFLSAGIYSIGINVDKPRIFSLYITPFLASALNGIKENKVFESSAILWICISLILICLYCALELKSRKNTICVFIIIIPLVITSFKMIGNIKENLPTKLNCISNIYYRNYLENQLVFSVPEEYKEEMISEGHTIIPKTNLTKLNEDNEIDILYNDDNSYIEEEQYIIEIKDEVPYSVSNYKMDINLKDGFSNKCRMLVNKKESDLKILKFSFFNKSKVKTLTINGQNADYEMDGSSIYIKIPEGIKDDELNMYIEYSANIYTYFGNVQEADFIMDKSGFLSGGFPWYPKLINNDEEEYIVNIDSESDNMYSNLNVDKKDGEYLITGVGKDIILMYGDISEIEYDGYIIIAPTPILKLNTNASKIVGVAKEYEKYNNDHNIKKIFLTPTDILKKYYYNECLFIDSYN